MSAHEEMEGYIEARMRELLHRWADEEEMIRGCAFCGSHHHPNRKCDAAQLEPAGIIAWLDAQEKA